MDRGRRVAGLVPVLLVASSVVVAGAPGPTAAEPSAEPSGDATTRLRAQEDPGGALLRRAARLSGSSVAELAEQLATDPTLRVDDDGRLRYVDPGLGPDRRRAAQREARRTTVRRGAPERRATPSAGTWSLHSNPGATRTLLLDFDGHRVAGTAWNDDLSTATHPAWDPAGDGPAVSAADATAIRTVWQRVAEDYAPFDIDVTTEDPGPAGLERSSTADRTYGVRVLVTPSTVAQRALCERCGGIAFLGVFGLLQPDYRTAWVFPQALAQDPKYVAEAASHEAGHTLGLSHDGRRGRPYFGGQGPWAAIMGAGYDKPVTQFSRGDYVGATNREDDLDVIAQHVGPRRDEAGGSPADAVPIGAGGLSSGVITHRDDQDTFALGTCTGRLTAHAQPAEVGADLDIGLALIDGSGEVVGYDDPLVEARDSHRAAGLDARIETDVPAGEYYLRIDGVGSGHSYTGYDDYASLGRYVLEAAGSCAGSDLEPVPVPVRSTTVLSAVERARAGTRPALRISVRRATSRGAGAAQGSVMVFLRGRPAGSAALREGRASYRLPKLARRPRRLPVRVVYLGDEDTLGSQDRALLRIRRR